MVLRRRTKTLHVLGGGTGLGLKRTKWNQQRAITDTPLGDSIRYPRPLYRYGWGGGGVPRANRGLRANPHTFLTPSALWGGLRPLLEPIKSIPRRRQVTFGTRVHLEA